jgi:hypothetical protein
MIARGVELVVDQNEKRREDDVHDVEDTSVKMIKGQ